ncbi:sortase [Streptomyces sp. DSM 42041]|uniref:Sortase n=1 Tax=Streptomyces hazeniae TaxID=3075538 RepID=A0ABU2NRW2_9ACTN|nr:sortase [Streptomyces sp. DSM 42041]MDT0379721.1 sortase [Streptomyces sp. DSM 42041]
MTTRYERLSSRSRRLEVVSVVAAVVFTVVTCRFVPGPPAANAAVLAADTGAVDTGAVDTGAAESGRAGSDRVPGVDAGGGEASGRAARTSPVRVAVRGTGVDARIVPVGERAGDGIPVAPPGDPMQVAWAAGLPAPGEKGAAVLVGHLDSETGPAAFAGLGGLRAGAQIRVLRADGRTVRYEVHAVQRYGAAGPPGALADVPEDAGGLLRLVAVGGAWTEPVVDDTSVVAFAHAS